MRFKATVRLTRDLVPDDDRRLRAEPTQAAAAWHPRIRERVLLPGLDDGKFPWGDRGDADGMLLQGSMLYVAMSRARDRLDISYSGLPTYFLGSLVDLLDQGSGPS